MIPISSATTRIKITSIDERLFKCRYFARCMECGFCHDVCCSYGCPVDITEEERILSFREELENRTGIPAREWFTDEIILRPEFPSGRTKKTRVYNNKCVFHNSVSRGCHLHSLALEMGLDPHSIKPMVCFLFPLTWDNPYLYVSDFLDELPCKNSGVLLLDSLLDEMKYYLGDDFVQEVRLKAVDREQEPLSGSSPNSAAGV